MNVQTLRKFVASVSATALLLSTFIVPGMGVNLAQAAEWYAPYNDVATSTEVGGFTDAAANMTRGEYFDLVVNAALVAGWISVDDYTGDAAETLKALNVVKGQGGTGDMDLDGMLTKEAALKILMILVGLVSQDEEGTNSVTKFTDVPADSWFAVYVLTAYENDYIRGEAGGSLFGAGSNINNAVGTKMAVVSLELAEEDGDQLTVVTLSEVLGTTTVVTGDLTVTLSSSSPSAATLPLGAMSVVLGEFKFTGTGTINSIVFKRAGVGVSADFTNVYVYNGNTRLKSGKTISSDTNTVEFTGLGIAVDGSVLVVLRGDVAGAGVATPGDEQRFSIESASSIGSTASVSGSFPVATPTFIIGSAAVSTGTIATGGALSKPVLGQSSAVVSKFKITAGNNNVALSQITLTSGGTLTSEKMGNFRLMQGTTELAVAAAIGASDRLVLVLAVPFEVAKNQNRNFEVLADILGGKSTDTIQFYLDETTDLVLIDKLYNFGAIVTNTLGSANVTAVTMQGGKVTVADNGPTAATIANNTTQVTLLKMTVTGEEGRSLTARDFDLFLRQTATSAGVIGTAAVNNVAGYTLVKGTNIAIAFDTAAGVAFAAGDVVVISGFYGLVVTNAAGVLTITPYNSGAILDNAVITMTWDASVSASKVTNLKLINLDTGATIYSTSTPGGYTLASDDFDIAGVMHLAIQVDLLSTLAATEAYQAGINLAVANYVKDNDANQFVATSDIVGGSLIGKTMTVAANTITVALAAIPTNKTVVKGDTNVESAGVSLTAGNAGAIRVTKLKLRVMADANGAYANTTGDTDADTLVSTVTLYKDGVKFAGPVGLQAQGTPGGATAADYRLAEFTNLTLDVAPGATVTLVASASLRNTPTATSFFYINMLPDVDVEAQDIDGNTLAIAQINPLLAANDYIANTGVVTTLPATPGTSDTGALVTISTSGTLTAYVEGGPSSAGLAVAGTTNFQQSRYRFHAQNEAFTVTKLTIVNDATGVFATAVNTSAASKITVRYTDMAGATKTVFGTVTAGSVTLSGLDFYVPNNGDAYLEILVDVSTVSAAGAIVSGQTFRFGILDNMGAANSAQVEAVGASSSTTINMFSQTASSSTNVLVSGNASVFAFVVRKSKPVFTVQTIGQTLSNGTMSLIKVKADADAAGSVTLARLVFTVTVNGSLTEVNNFQVFDSSSQITTANIFVSDGTVYASAAAGLDTADTAGNDASVETDLPYSVVVTFNTPQVITHGTTYFTLKADISGAGTSDSLSTKLAVGDESTQLTGLTANVNNTNANTGLVCATGDATTGIFTVCTATPAAGEFAAGANLTTRNIIWSDQSANAYAYPTVTTGAVTTSTGSDDYTNGYALRVTNEPSTTLTY